LNWCCCSSPAAAIDAATTTDTTDIHIYQNKRYNSNNNGYNMATISIYPHIYPTISIYPHTSIISTIKLLI
jgi:hypothetical protein